MLLFFQEIWLDVEDAVEGVAHKHGTAAAAAAAGKFPPLVLIIIIAIIIIAKIFRF